jgi:hypothetical protein
MLKSFFVQIQASADPQSTLTVSFEDVVSQLELLPRMFIEWDGSFVWRGENQDTFAAESVAWQLDGMVYDHLGSVRYLELKGSCQLEPWKKLLSVLGWPQQEFTIHHVNEGRFEPLDSFTSNFIS